jgi:alkylation response protein AidB-like acyl-CoA dehydrogenase
MSEVKELKTDTPGAAGHAVLRGPALGGVREAIEEDLKPNLKQIDSGGEYPERFMRRLGAAGGFAQGVPVGLGGSGAGITGTIRVMEEVSAECLSTGFCVWCQTVCGWYIQNGGSDYLKDEVLPGIANGEILAATGLSNPMKHFSGIERIKIHAEPDGSGGYTLNGAIPWVSNVGHEHYFAVVASVGGAEGGYMMAVIRGDDPGVTLGHGGHFIALEGSSTYSVTLRDVHVPGESVLASPAKDYIVRIRPGFVLTQAGFGLGLTQSCIELMKRANRGSRGVPNGFLEDQAEDIEADLDAARSKTYALAEEIGCGDTGALDPPRPGLMPEVVEARIAASELSLRASQAAMLHMGAAGYRSGSAAERKVREAYFVAVVTPAIKQLKKNLHDMKRTG